LEIEISYHFGHFTITTRNVRRNEIGKALEKIEDVRGEMKKIYTRKRPKVLPVTKSF
jgi:hypothetical protein